MIVHAGLDEIPECYEAQRLLAEPDGTAGAPLLSRHRHATPRR